MFQWFHNLKIKQKLIGAFSFIAILTIILGIVMWMGQSTTIETMDNLLNVESQLVNLSYRTEIAVLTARGAGRDYLLKYRQLGFDRARNLYITELEQQVSNVHQYMEEMRALKPDDKTLIADTQQIDAVIDEYRTTFLDTVESLEAQGYANAGTEGEFERKIQQVQGVVNASGDRELLLDVMQVRLYAKDYIHLRNESYANYLDNANKKLIADIRSSGLSDGDKKTLTTLVKQYQQLFAQVIDIDAKVIGNQAKYQTTVEKLPVLLENIRTHSLATQNATVQDVEKTAHSAQVLALILSVVVVIAGIFAAVVLSRAIGGAVTGISQAAQKLAEGDLDQQVTATGNDELGEMAAAFSKMIAYFKEMSAVANSLAEGDLTATVTPLSDRDELGNAFARMSSNWRQLITQITASVAQLGRSAQSLTLASGEAGGAAEQVAQGVQAVAGGAAQQAEHISRANSTVQQVSQAVAGVAQGAQEQAAAIGDSMGQVEQISGTVEQVAENAQLSTAQAAQAAQVAQTGAQVVEKTIGGMAVIKEKVALSVERVQKMGQVSQRIETIVETIDNIAAQTNLLALNAAIEAARAGEHGKGFAVVADEVRKLAEKSAAATGEIANLISDIQSTITEAIAAMDASASEVDNGVQLAEQSGAALMNILQVVEDLQKQVSSIASASQAMNTASDELVSLMSSVSAVVEENTASTEEMTAGVTEVSESIAEIAGISQNTSAVAQSVSAATEEMSTQVEQVAGASQQLQQLANSLMVAMAKFKIAAGNDEGMLNDLEVFRYTHLRWLDDIQAMFAGEKHLNGQNLKTADECLLGQWYHSEATLAYRDWPEFQEIDAAHRRFHELTGELVSLYNAGDPEAAREQYPAVEEASHAVVIALANLETRISG